MIDLLAIAVRLRDDSEEQAQLNASFARGCGDARVYGRSAAQAQILTWDIATLDGIARAVTEAGEAA